MKPWFHTQRLYLQTFEKASAFTSGKQTQNDIPKQPLYQEGILSVLLSSEAVRRVLSRFPDLRIIIFADPSHALRTMGLFGKTSRLQ